jgi:ADP-ribose pyrophosphatase YjhB (NUDIX family)
VSQNFPRIGSALLVRDSANRILLGKRNKDPQRGAWVIPGGKIQPFESIGDAGIRELREETGLEVEVVGPFRVYEIINPPDEHRIVIYSWANLIAGIAQASDDISELKFFSRDQLSGLPTSPLVRKVLNDAGLTSQHSIQSRHEIQMKFVFFPMLIASVEKMPSVKLRNEKRKYYRPKRSETVSITSSHLPFDG